MISNTWAEGLNPKSVPMSKVKSELFVTATLAELGMGKLDVDLLNKQFLVQVLNKRIEVRALPIKFTDFAKMATLAFCDTPGALVALLVDCLNKYEGQEVNCAMLADLYPMGFYDEPTMMRYIDDYLKTRKVKWSEIY